MSLSYSSAKKLPASYTWFFTLETAPLVLQSTDSG